MAEEENNEEEQEDQGAEEAPNIVDKAAKAVVELREQNKIMSENIAQAQKLAALQMVSGQSEAGTAPPEPKQETPQEYAQRILNNDLKANEGRI